MVKNSHNPIAQIVKRLEENKNSEKREPKSFGFKLNEKDCFFFTKAGDLCKIVKILDDADVYECQVTKNRYLDSFYNILLDSKGMDLSFFINKGGKMLRTQRKVNAIIKGMRSPPEIAVLPVTPSHV